MASISSLSGSSSSSSIYGNRTYNIISGLASGLDTESLISGVVQSYQQKIQNLQNKNTKLQWQQEAYQNISDKLVEFSRNYTSYVYSSTNLMSSSFFNSAVITTTGGNYADLVSATGKTSSDVILNAVRNLATTARYSASANHLDTSIVADSQSGTITASGDKKLDLSDDVELSKLAGSLTLNYGNRSLSIEFGQRELFTKEDGSLDAEAFQKNIVEKLQEQQISTSSGSLVTADTLIGVSVSDSGVVSFYDKSGAGNQVSIAGATGDLANGITGLEDVIENKGAAFHLSDAVRNDASDTKTMADYLDGKSITVTFNGKSKTIDLPKASGNFQSDLNAALSDAFGAGNVTASFNSEGKLSFTVASGSTLSVTSSNTDVADVMGLGSGLTSYLNTNKTLGDLSGLGWDWTNQSGEGTKVMGTGTITEEKDAEGHGTGKYVDEAGKSVDKDGYRLDENGDYLYGFDLVINGKKIGTYTKETELNTVINNINGNTDAGVSVSYSQTTGQFVFTAKDTGAGGRIEIKDGLGAAIFGSVTPPSDPSQSAVTSIPGAQYTAGVDATFNVTINGQNMELTRSSNTFDLDGMSVTLNGTFNEDVKAEDVDDLAASDKVTFTSKTDSDTIIDAVKKMVEDLNTIIKEVKSAYSDMPLEKSDGSSYEPLTDEDMSDMSESAIEAYEEKAKTGILFMDSDLSSLYSELRNAISAGGADGVTLRSIGIDVSYSDGLTTLTLDEDALREALESDPDKVQQAFTKSKENGASTDGLMVTLQSITERYAATSGDVKGILIEKAGSKYSPSAALDNTLLNQMQEVEEEISKWQDKMSNQVDYYTNKFTQLELLINQMNSQSSALSGLLGG